MKHQLTAFDKLYGYSRIVKKLNDDELAELEIIKQIVEDIANKMQSNLTFNYHTIVQMIQRDKRAKTIRNKRIGSAVIIGYILTEQNDIEWINCNCAEIGKFRRRK